MVYLIGAGPGDPGLLTLKAARAIASSDVVIYDELVNPEVLSHARRKAELVFAGKRAGRPSATQMEINCMLVRHGLRGKTVARLKGGDPFVFGRGAEEAEALVAAGIRWEVVPGVSSGVAAAAYAGIPLTHRGHASSVAFVTGHDAPRKRRDPVDWSRLARSADTLVIFMCARTIGRIAAELVAAGRGPSTPLAIVRWGTYADQKVYAGTLADAIDASESGTLAIEAPAIAIVGDVVALRDRLHWFGAPASPLPRRAAAAWPFGAEIEEDAYATASV